MRTLKLLASCLLCAALLGCNELPAGATRNEATMKQPKCPDCGTSLGDLHEFFCIKERCPFCGGQLVSCGCIVTVLKLTDAERQAVEEYGDDTEEPLMSINNRWRQALEAKGRAPFNGNR